MNKKLFLGSLLMLALTMTGCQQTNSKDSGETSNVPGEISGDSTPGSTEPVAHTHSWAKTWTTDDEYHWHVCSGCNEINDKAAHSWDAGTVTVPASAYKPGEKQYKCTVCNKVKKEVLPATGGNEPVGNFTFNDTDLGTAQEIHTTNQLGYLNLDKPYYEMTGTDLNKFQATGASSLTKTSWAPNAVTVSWTYAAPAGKTVTNYSFVYGQKSDLADAYELPSTVATESVSFKNAYLGDNYFKVIANLSDGTKEASPIKVFKVTTQAPRNLDVGNMPNCRDMGGRTTYAGGKVRQGLIYRTSGSNFDNRTASNAEAKKVLLEQLRVKTEINVANGESNNVKLTGTKVVNAFMDYGATPYSNLARNAEKIRQVMSVLSDESNYPVFYHCRIGTDRTGITGVMINGLVGVPFNEVIQDYGFSNFSPIDNQRYPGKTPDNNGDDIKKYIDEILAMPGVNFQEQVYNTLLTIGVPASQLNKIIDIMTEGTKATFTTKSTVAKGDDLTSNGTRQTNSDFDAPAVAYSLSSGKAASMKATVTAGQKDVVVYLGSTDASTSTKLGDCITLKIDGQEQTIAIANRTLHRAGFGETQNLHRTGYMMNLLGKYDLTAGERTIEVSVKKGTFNVGTIAVFDHVEPNEPDNNQQQGGQGGQQQAHEHAFTYGADISATGKSTYKTGTCTCGDKAVKIAVNANVDGEPNKRPFKLSSNGQYATYTFDYTGTLTGKLYLLCGVDNYNTSGSVNKQYGFFYQGSPNLKFEINGAEATITNTKSYEECGVQDGGDSDESKAALMEVCAASLQNGSNTIKITRLASRSATIYDIVLIGK